MLHLHDPPVIFKVNQGGLTIIRDCRDDVFWCRSMASRCQKEGLIRMGLTRR